MSRMARANRLPVPGGIFHVTHRCHNRQFLLKFSRGMDLYRKLLRARLAHYPVFLLDYCLTSNHVHLLLDSDDKRHISDLMRDVAGDFARKFNGRKARFNAFWGDNFHATLVEDGLYLGRCQIYIELNMVRCRVVMHPSEWEWTGYREIMGERKRYRLINMDRLCWRLQALGVVELRKNFEERLSERMRKNELTKREPIWTESLAVGSASFVKAIQPLVLTRRETEIFQDREETYVLREHPIAYSPFLHQKNVSNAITPGGRYE